jgi:hypothetical protein
LLTVAIGYRFREFGLELPCNAATLLLIGIRSRPAVPFVAEHGVPQPQRDIAELAVLIPSPAANRSSVRPNTLGQSTTLSRQSMLLSVLCEENRSATESRVCPKVRAQDSQVPPLQ